MTSKLWLWNRRPRIRRKYYISLSSCSLISSPEKCSARGTALVKPLHDHHIWWQVSVDSHITIPKLKQSVLNSVSDHERAITVRFGQRGCQPAGGFAYSALYEYEDKALPSRFSSTLAQTYLNRQSVVQSRPFKPLVIRCCSLAPMPRFCLFAFHQSCRVRVAVLLALLRIHTRDNIGSNFQQQQV